MKLLGRIHIPVGYILALLIIGMSAAFCRDLRGNDSLPLKAVSAQTVDHHWRTSAMLTALPGATSTVQVHLQNEGGACPTPPIPLVPNGAAYVRDVAYTYFCGGGEFQLFPLPAGADIATVLSFDDGKTQSSFTLPPIGAITNTTPQRCGPIVNDGEEGTWITVFPSRETPMTAEVYDGAGKFVARELFDVKPPVSQYGLVTPLRVGFVLVKIGWPGFDLYPPVYGFVNSGTPRGGNFRVFPFGQ